MEDALYDYNEEYMLAAFGASKYATCDRRHVGCVIVKDDIVLGRGYNTSPLGTKTCDEVGHLMVDGSCKRTIHAEMNACMNAIKQGFGISWSNVYVTDQPCSDCLKFLTNLGISKVFYVSEYPFKYEVETDIEMVKVDIDWGSYNETISCE